MKEASARININKLLENACWRFFAHCEYFEEKCNYDQVIKLHKPKSKGGGGGGGCDAGGDYEHLGGDILASIKENVSLNQFIA